MGHRALAAEALGERVRSTASKLTFFSSKLTVQDSLEGVLCTRLDGFLVRGGGPSTSCKLVRKRRR